MKNLKVWQRFVLMAAVTVIPFGFVTYKMVSSIDALGLEFARQELRGVAYYRPLVSLIKNLQQHRGMSAALLSGDASFKSRLDAKRLDVENDLKAIAEVDERFGTSLQTTSQWSALRGSVRTALDSGGDQSPADSFARQTAVIHETIALITRVGDTSNLTLDPDLDTYYLMNIAIFQGPELAEVLAQARGQGGSIAAAKSGSPEQLARMSELSVLMRYLRSRVDDSFAKA